MVLEGIRNLELSFLVNGIPAAADDAGFPYQPVGDHGNGQKFVLEAGLKEILRAMGVEGAACSDGGADGPPVERDNPLAWLGEYV